MPLKSHHKAWLSLHPDRSEEWLQARLLDGFDVHHLDHNHANNDPANLVLIEAQDHMRVHEMRVTVKPRTLKRGGRPRKPKPEPKPAPVPAPPPPLVLPQPPQIVFMPIPKDWTEYEGMKRMARARGDYSEIPHPIGK